MLTRLVRIINVAIAICVVLIAFTVYWYALRPLPETSGHLQAPIAQTATIKRDARGIPHIEASSWQDAIFLQGYATAQDRLWQMDSLRRFGAGELAEVFGSGALNADVEMRRFRMRAIADTAVSHLRPQDRAILSEYARGVNYFIDSHRGDYGLEFSLPGHAYDPRPWTLSDSVLVGLVMFEDLTDSSKFELDKGTLLGRGADPTKTMTLFPAVQGTYLSPGSNAWAISGAHAADGNPMVANDPHLSYGIPGTWHLVHLKAPGLNVSGAALPGVPSVITGHNDRIAWGVTNLQADVMDLYAERIDLKTGQYVFRGAVQQAVLDRETIKIRDRKAVEQDIWVTVHGPVIFVGGRQAISMRWSATDGFGLPFFDIDRAHNWGEFRAALEPFWGPAQNFIYGDRSGNIGYQAAGRVPIRHGFDGDVPLDGASGTFEWDGYIPYDQMPSLLNPASGVVATSNQSPFPPLYPYRVPGNFADRFRVEQVRALLSAKSKLTVDDILAVQKDVYAAHDAFLASQMVAACNKQSCTGELRAATDIVKRWNGQMEYNQAAPAITELFNNHLGVSLLEIAARPFIARAEAERKAQPARKGQTPAPQLPLIIPRPQIIDALLKTRPSGWVPKDDWNAWLMQNLAGALEEGRQRQGSHLAEWRWGRLLEWKFAHPIGKSLPLVDGFFDIGPVPMSGSGTTVKQTTATLGPSERMVADLGDWDRSVQNLPAGESGHVASAHYKDQWPAYYAGRSFPMEFDKVEARDVLTVNPLPPGESKPR